ncbi:SapB/AmfS family lanthipeptide [Streptomyces boncukensis]|uniref:SapB/AmfS family lantipeptide n=1 Tax=Streptomyces boncukensis TaxID=2711219 RepID=A0A6G4X0U3_9ACTN|nr:SapB/AmfS family lanthipeptide [Streptomyces boncukensis]NGO71169.1 SapB/AmfS family lantipeptide [Streptomyces boncukensis]
MALLDLQTMEPEETATHGGGGSVASLLLCGDSALSLVTCHH